LEKGKCSKEFKMMWERLGLRREREAGRGREQKFVFYSCEPARETRQKRGEWGGFWIWEQASNWPVTAGHGRGSRGHGRGARQAAAGWRKRGWRCFGYSALADIALISTRLHLLHIITKASVSQPSAIQPCSPCPATRQIDEQFGPPARHYSAVYQSRPTHCTVMNCNRSVARRPGEAGLHGTPAGPGWRLVAAAAALLPWRDARERQSARAPAPYGVLPGVRYYYCFVRRARYGCG
jgi:hypothetical protein